MSTVAAALSHLGSLDINNGSYVATGLGFLSAAPDSLTCPCLVLDYNQDFIPIERGELVKTDTFQLAFYVDWFVLVARVGKNFDRSALANWFDELVAVIQADALLNSTVEFPIRLDQFLLGNVVYMGVGFHGIKVTCKVAYLGA